MAEYDLISKRALLKHLDMAIDCKDCLRNINKDLYTCNMRTTFEGCTCSEVSQICCRITNFVPVADVQSVKRGKWELTNNPSFRKCSECGTWWSSNFTDSCFTNYCPRCGARMDGDANG